jgi:hypothetical protein
MGLTPKTGMSAYLSGLIQLLICSVLLISKAQAHCYTSEIKVPALYMPKHIELSLDIEKEIISLEESIKQLDQEIEINPPQAPIFLAVLCLASKDLSEMITVPKEKTLYAAYILPSTSYVLLAHGTGS